MPELSWTPIEKSSQIAAAAHDGADLWVRFRSGGTYRYVDVPEHHHVGLVAADSAGQYLARHVKAGGFRFERVEG